MNQASFLSSALSPVEVETQLAHRQRLETLGILAGGVAHDFNNLLTMILGHTDGAEALLPTDHPARAELARVQGAAQRASTLVRRILNFGRPSASRPVPLDLVQLVEESLPLLRSGLPRQIELRVRFDVATGMVSGDAGQLQQVLFNIGINSLHALNQEPGLVEVTLSRLPAGSSPAVQIGQLPAGPLLCVAISDTGCGMDDATRQRIFEPYFTTKARSNGTGLGLSIAGTIVLQHGGGIGVQSAPREGSIFRVYLPELPPPRVEAAGPARPADTGTLGHVAILDDEETVVRLATQALEFAGYRTTALSSPHHCVELLAQEPSKFDLILTDQRMPNMSGVEMVQCLRAQGITTPILITSGSIAAVTARELHDAAPARFLAKPFTLVELLSAVHELVALRRRAT